MAMYLYDYFTEHTIQYMDLQRDVFHLVSIIMLAVCDKEMWMKFQSGCERLLADGSKNFVLYEWVVKNDRTPTDQPIDQ